MLVLKMQADKVELPIEEYIKKRIFELLEDEFDLEMIEKYIKNKVELETFSIEEVMKLFKIND